MNAITDLVVKVTGQVTESNFDQYKQQIIERIRAAKKELKTDDDFVEAEDLVKQFQVVEKSLVQAKSDALEQAAEVQRMFDAIDEVTEEARQARLSLSKQIATRKQQIKDELVATYAETVASAYDDLVESSPCFRLVQPHPFTSHDVLTDSIKGLKTVKSIESRLDERSSELIAELNILDGEYNANDTLLKRVGSEHQSLFQDRKALLVMSRDLLEATIQKRIATFEADQLRIKQEELERQAKAKEAEQAKPAEETPKSRPPAASAQKNDTTIHPDPTGGGDQVTPQPEVDTSSPQSLQIVIEVFATADEAKSLARALNEQFFSTPIVKTVRLKRAEAA